MSKIIHDRPRDCLGCRLVSGGGLIGVGIYVGYHGNRMRGASRFGFMCIASAAVGLGAARLLNLPPFDTFSTSQEQLSKNDKSM